MTRGSVGRATPSELWALAERCRKASGADRVLDKDIAVAICGLRVLHLAGVPAGEILEAPDGTRVTVYDHTEPHGVRLYTASIDAAVTLVPEGLSFKLWGHPDESCCDVYWTNGDPQNPRAEIKGDAEQAKTPALAVACAALHAQTAVSKE